MGKGIISYDSPWEEIRDCARAADWSGQPQDYPSSLKRLPLTESEISRLADMPVLLIDEGDLPPHPKHSPSLGQASFQYAGMLANRTLEVQRLVRAAGASFNRYDTEGGIIDIAQQTTAHSFLTYYDRRTPDCPALRQGDEPTQLNTAMPHRLEGHLMPASAIVLTNGEFDTQPGVIAAASRRLWLPHGDYKVMCDLHEVMHLLQLQNQSERTPLKRATLDERDAENGALKLYQTAFGGPAHLAAAAIVAHMSYQFEIGYQYGFRPGLALDKLDHGNADTTALRMAALYVNAGQQAPRFLALQAYGHRRAKNLPAQIEAMFGDELDEIALWASNYYASRGHRQTLEDTLKGLKQLADREFETIPEQIRPLARQLADAAAFTNPEIMGYDPVKPRVSYHFIPKRNDATLA